MASGRPLRREAREAENDADRPEGDDMPRTRSRRARRESIAAAPGLDRLVHERVRLGILSALAVNDVMSFNDLKRVLDTTDGNLSVHARKLEDAGLVACTKSFEGRRPQTEYEITREGRRALEQYLGHMEALIRAVRGESGPEADGEV